MVHFRFHIKASLQNILADHKRRYGSLRLLPKMAAIHLNDTHPALAIPELMRCLGKGVRNFKDGMKDIETEVDDIKKEIESDK